MRLRLQGAYQREHRLAQRRFVERADVLAANDTKWLCPSLQLASTVCWRGGA